jgi:hypothetical protein
METFGTRFESLSLLLGGLLIVCNPVALFAASFPDTTKAHFGKNGMCSEHMDDPTPIGPPPQTFTLCARQSGATHWSADIKRTVFPFTTVCSQPKVAVNGGQRNFQCNITATGSFKGQVNWWVGSSGMMPGVPDLKFTR